MGRIFYGWRMSIKLDGLAGLENAWKVLLLVEGSE